MDIKEAINWLLRGDGRYATNGEYTLSAAILSEKVGGGKCLILSKDARESDLIVTKKIIHYYPLDVLLGDWELREFGLCRKN